MAGGMLSLATKIEGKMWALEFPVLVRAWADSAGELLVERLKDAAPVNKNAGGDPDPQPPPGTLRDSIAFNVVDGAKVLVTAVGYAEFVINSTQPHLIEGSPLAFFSGGEQVFATNVEHPGTQANPFHRKVWEASRDEVVGMLRVATIRNLHE